MTRSKAAMTTRCSRSMPPRGWRHRPWSATADRKLTGSGARLGEYEGSISLTVRVTDMELIAVGAIAENNVIGMEGELPWPSIPADKQQYRELVSNSAVILGRRTFESMRDDLPGAQQIVLSRQVDRAYPESTVTVVNSVDEAIDTLDSHGYDRAFVLGGAGIYDAFFPVTDRLHISRIPGNYRGDVTFPSIDPSEWERTESVSMPGFTLEQWVRRSP